MINPYTQLKTAIKNFLPPMPTPPPPHELDRSTLLQLAAIIGIALIAHFAIANPIIAIFSLVVFSLKFAAIWFKKKSPPSFIMGILLVFSIALVIFFYGGWNGQIAGISFIVLLVSLKFLESRLLRDYYIVCLLLYFLAASSFLFNSSIISIFVVITYTIAITAILFKISTPSKLSSAFAIKESCKIIIRALPLAIFLFFTFPRMHGSFGFIPSQDDLNNNEIKDSLIAGEMATSAFDNSLAFRVQFDGPMPSRDQLYWRSKVMPVELNFQWEVLDVSKRDFVSANLKKKALNLDKGQISYQVLHESSRDKFLPYLDFVSGTSRGKILDDYSIFDDSPKTSTFAYTGSSTFKPSLPASIKLNEAQLLNTQSKPSERLQALIDSWREISTDEQELVQLVYSHYTNNEFNYSLLPPLLDDITPLDDFIFNTRTGYCEHYASSFTILMRWLGIPARVVVGFQGGKINQAGNYLEVRYSDAHAWSEVFIDEQWQRVDPTAAISPERIEFGMDALTQLWDGDNFGNASGKALSNILNPTGAARYLQKARDSWDNVSYQWNKWVVNYDREKQQELLENLGLEHKNSLTTLVGIIAFGVVGFMLFYFWQMIPKPSRLEEIQKAYLAFTKKFQRYGIHKMPGETPADFQTRTSIRFPKSSEQISIIINAYQQLRYGRRTDDYDDDLSQFKQRVKQFKLILK